MSRDLEREIQRLLDAGESPSEKLAQALENAPELQRAAQELEQLDALLGEWSSAPLELDEDVFARRIAQRLDEPLAPLQHDPILPPAFDDADSRRRAEDEHSGEFALSALTDQLGDRPEAASEAGAKFAQPPAPPAQPPAAEPRPAGTVVRMEPRQSSRWVFAAAAVVGLVAVGGLFMVSSHDSEPSMAMVSAEVREEAPAAQGFADEAAPAPTSSARSLENTYPVEPEVAAAEAAETDLGDDLGALAFGTEAEDEEHVLAGASGTAAARGATMQSARLEASPIVEAEAPPARMMRRRSPGAHADPAKASVVRRTQARVFGCFDVPPPRVRVQVWIDARTGRVREVDVPSGGRPAEVECVRRVVRSSSFPSRDGVARYTTTLEYER